MEDKNSGKKNKRKEVKERLKQKEEKILEDSRKFNKELARLKLEEVEEITRKIVAVIPGEVPDMTFGAIMAIIAEYQKKKEEPFIKLMEMQRQREIMDLMNTRLDDPDYWTKANVGMLLYKIKIPGTENLPAMKKRATKYKPE